MSKQVVVDNISRFLDVVDGVLTVRCLAEGKTVSGSALAKEIGREYGLSQSQGAMLISLLVSNRDDLKSRPGKGGGISKA